MVDSDGDSDGMNEISQLLNDYTSLQAAHRSLAKRCETQASEIYKEVEDELESLRIKIKDLEEKLEISTNEKDELSATVRDLRVRVEESRRAIMRLQGPGGSSSTLASGNQNSNLVGGISNAANNPNRRSILPGALQSWNPKEITSSLMTPQGSSSGSPDQTYSHHTPEEVAELNNSKRASLAFGPNANAQGTIGKRAQGHRRIASGSRIGQSDDDASSISSMALLNSNSQGLRELHLGVGPSPLPSANSSKRNSFLGLANALSPTSDTVELPQEEVTEKKAPVSLVLPVKSSRRISIASNLSANAREDMDVCPELPVNSGRSNLPSSASNTTSPISEVDENEALGSVVPPRPKDIDEPWTARLYPSKRLSFSFGRPVAPTQQEQQPDVASLQKLILEQKIQLQDKDTQLEEMRRDIMALKIRLEEADEARKASETCLKALKDFVKDEGGESTDTEGGVQLLKGIKLPPLPTDIDTDDLSNDSTFHPSTPGRRFTVADVRTPTQTMSSGAWRSFSSTFANLSRAKSYASEEFNDRLSTTEEDAPSTPVSPVVPLSPSVNISNSLGSLWNRSSISKRQHSMSVSSSTPSVPSSLAESRNSSVISSSPGELPTPGSVMVGASPTVYTGFNWFSKKLPNEECVIDAPPPIPSRRVSTPPFASLDYNVLTLDLVDLKPSNHSNTSSPTGEARTPPLEPNDRIRKTMQKAEVIDEHTDFTPPLF